MGILRESGQAGRTALFGALKGFYPSGMEATTATVSSGLHHICFMRLASLSWSSMISTNPIIFPRVLNALVAYIIHRMCITKSLLKLTTSNASTNEHSLLDVEPVIGRPPKVTGTLCSRQRNSKLSFYVKFGIHDDHDLDAGMTGYNITRSAEELLDNYESDPPSFSIHLHPDYWTLNNGPKFLYNNPVAVSPD